MTNPAPRDTDLDRLWNEAKAVEMNDEERAEQRILDAAANGNISDSRITVETMRATRLLMDAEQA